MLLYNRKPYWQYLANGYPADQNKNGSNGNCVRPATNITERNDDFVLQMALPGYDKKEIVIDIDNQLLVISSKMEMKPGENETALKREFHIVPFERRFELPESVDGENIEARFKDGILTLVIPKKEYAKAKPPREIAIA